MLQGNVFAYFALGLKMSIRLQAEQCRLFGFEVASNGELAPLHVSPAHPSTRCLVLGLGQPAQWDPLLRAWEGVQSALSLPPPAIAVDGVDGSQLWFSLAEAVPVHVARRFLQLVAARHLADVGPACVRCVPSIDGSGAQSESCLQPVPTQQSVSGHWSAFVSPDLARIFEAEPWLERQPSPDAQADLISRTVPASAQAFQRALALLDGEAQSMAPCAVQAESVGSVAGPAQFLLDPRAFLLSVMNDPSVDMRIRVDAAKALLPQATGL